MKKNRRMLISGLAVVSASLLVGTSPVLSQSISTLHRRKRVPLPKMGPSFRQQVSFSTAQKPGTLIIKTEERALYLVTQKDTAYRYRISIGREGFGWTGNAKVGAKKEWPAWRPPSEMRQRQPDLPDFVPAGPYNPLGARALYLYDRGRDTLYRIHGTNNPDGVGFDGTSGCFRLTNTDIVDLFTRVPIGTRVIVE